uniref:Uncharacterized protein n=1 Tax=Plectus sambesii TaxID=2011161 RepID=A0A914W9D4_9BILA
MHDTAAATRQQPPRRTRRRRPKGICRGSPRSHSPQPAPNTPQNAYAPLKTHRRPTLINNMAALYSSEVATTPLAVMVVAAPASACFGLLRQRDVSPLSSSINSLSIVRSAQIFAIKRRTTNRVKITATCKRH